MSEEQNKYAKEERQRLLAKIFENKEIMTAEYKVLVKHTGGLVSGSMAVAYSRALNDVIKLLLKEENNEKSIQKESQSADSKTARGNSEGVAEPVSSGS